MASFATYDETNDRYTLKGIIPAQETLRPEETVNPPFELAYWHFGLTVAQRWRERMDQPRNPAWDTIIAKLSPLAAKDGLYLAAETAEETYSESRFTSDHMAVLGAVGILPASQLVREDWMHETFDWIYNNWNWDQTWGWDYPMTAMNAVRMGEPRKAIDALMMDKRTNTYLTNGHNYQNEQLRCYLPGNGGLLTAVALMCAGWDGWRSRNAGVPERRHVGRTLGRSPTNALNSYDDDETYPLFAGNTSGIRFRRIADDRRPCPKRETGSHQRRLFVEPADRSATLTTLSARRQRRRDHRRHATIQSGALWSPHGIPHGVQRSTRVRTLSAPNGR